MLFVARHRKLLTTTSYRVLPKDTSRKLRWNRHAIWISAGHLDRILGWLWDVLSSGPLQHCLARVEPHPDPHRSRLRRPLILVSRIAPMDFGEAPGRRGPRFAIALQATDGHSRIGTRPTGVPRACRVTRVPEAVQDWIHTDLHVPSTAEASGIWLLRHCPPASRGNCCADHVRGYCKFASKNT